ncbi:MAG: hypothetical protein ACI9FN_001326 [Saprospiraceae bacterium]|jgi:hypothetical protein
MWGQDDYAKQVFQSWETYKTVFIKKDFMKASTLSNPMVVEKTGEETYVVDDLLYEQGMYESQGIILKEIKSKQSSAVIKSTVEWQAMIPYERILKHKMRKLLKTISCLLHLKIKTRHGDFLIYPSKIKKA